MKYSFKFFIIFCLSIALVYCKSKDQPDIEQEISEIEHNLTQSVIIKGVLAEKFSLEDRMKHYKVPGVSIAVVKDGKIHWAKGYGIANAETKTMVDINTVF